MFDQNGRFVIKNYKEKTPFSSFLPGIAGELGVPLWCFYNNRGQAVCSFGAQDKDHAIMEFAPAHVAYRDVSRTGFRTFCKINGHFRELFTGNADMHIGMGELEITECGEALSVSALYFGVPEERCAALARILSVTNTSSDPIELELLDGMAAVVPYGLNQDFLKNMTQLAKAWMQCEDHTEGRAYFRVRASLEDGAVVREVKGGNFCLGFDENGHKLLPLVQPSILFGRDTSLSDPQVFQKTSLTELLTRHQVTSNQVLCCFLPRVLTLQPGETAKVYSIYGQAESKTSVAALAEKIHSPQWFEVKHAAVQNLVKELTNPISCETGNSVFDAYAKQTYLDNLLRGGTPVFFRSGDTKVPFHLYSRKHGDPEREYNYFSLGKEYFAQGNGNFRDINQNRRCDVLFSPETEDYNIKMFFDLIQSDGYNPLVILPGTFRLDKQMQKQYTQRFPGLAKLLSGDFTPGKLAMELETIGLTPEEVKITTADIICSSSHEPNANFGEGYWTDHWTYNLDLIESYLSVYPERKQELLFRENTCRWYDTKVFVNPRVKRYCMTENGLRQYHALDEHRKQSTHKWMIVEDGYEVRSSILEKILLLCAIKTATLDPLGMGVEMEGGRPGWYDALNGLPGLLGSSMAESCELARLIRFVIETLEQHPGGLFLYEEISGLIDSVSSILKSTDASFARWDALNSCKEAYREQTIYGFSGKKKEYSSEKLISSLKQMEEAILRGIAKAKEYTDDILPTYFTFEATKILQTEEGLMPTEFLPTPLPLFLEGPVRYLKLSVERSNKQKLAEKVRESGLYDRKLKMYKVNESLSGVRYEAGRALAFTPGWLENESVWLHMEYKYLLELLKNGLYAEFAEAFRDAAVPFLDPEMYGRSPLENVSFIASSANPDPVIHGQGFVARLSGSTAEFIHIWQIMFFGTQPFRWDGNQLTLQFTPLIPSYLMPTDTLKSTFLGKIPVTYHTNKLTALIPGQTRVAKYVLHKCDDQSVVIDAEVICGMAAEMVRNGKVSSIDVYIA